MGAMEPKEAKGQGARSAATLGDVLYARNPKMLILEKEWAALVGAMAAGNQPALHALYERTHRIVYTLIVRLVGNRNTAEEVTLDVFFGLWRSASRYDPANGTVLGWIMNQARSRALDRLRVESARKRVDPNAGDSAAEEHVPGPQELLELRQRLWAARSALSVLTSAEREVIEAAFFADLTHAEVAARLNQPLGTVKTRIRSALQKLRDALRAETSEEAKRA
jgi:RNA polymerase sigma-70 factor, ECF subfamily